MEADFNVMRDLEAHLRIAKLPIEQFSTLAKEGDEKLVQKFLTENVHLDRKGGDVLQSQFYIACFWGIRDIVQVLLDKGVNVNSQNRGSLWTPLHAACFQEHGPVVMMLLEAGAQPEIADAEGRTAQDFASASDKIWPHFAALGLRRRSKQELMDKGVLRKNGGIRSGGTTLSAFYGIKMADYSQPDSSVDINSDPFIHAAVTGDVLADIDNDPKLSQQLQPQFNMWR
ncbi:hypothetical protein ScPMuIL_016248 [Solemya velum]